MTQSALVPLPRAAASGGSSAVALSDGSQIDVPAVIAAAGGDANRAYKTYFAATIRNPGTRKVYAAAVNTFLNLCAAERLDLHAITTMHVAAYVEMLNTGTNGPNGERLHKPATVLLHLSALRGFFDFLEAQRVIDRNPVDKVKGPKLQRREGKTPVLTPEDAQKLLDSIPQGTRIGQRDKAFIATMLYSFARVSAVRNLRARDVIRQGTRYSLQLMEKGSQDRRVPCHPQLAEILHRWMETMQITDPAAPLFTTFHKGDKPTEILLSNRDALFMIKRRAEAAGLSPAQVCNHAMRATGIATYLMHGGTLERAKELAGHAQLSTTQLYDRRSSMELMDDIERLRFETPARPQP